MQETQKTTKTQYGNTEKSLNLSRPFPTRKFIISILVITVVTAIAHMIVNSYYEELTKLYYVILLAIWSLLCIASYLLFYFSRHRASLCIKRTLNGSQVEYEFSTITQFSYTFFTTFYFGSQQQVHNITSSIQDDKLTDSRIKELSSKKIDTEALERINHFLNSEKDPSAEIFYDILARMAVAADTRNLFECSFTYENRVYTVLFTKYNYDTWSPKDNIVFIEHDPKINIQAHNMTISQEDMEKVGLFCVKYLYFSTNQKECVEKYWKYELGTLRLK